MNVVVRREAPESAAADALVVGLHAQEKRWPPSLIALDGRAGGQIKAVLDAEKFSAKVGQVTHIHTPALASPRLVVAGLGPRTGFVAETLRRNHQRFQTGRLDSVVIGDENAHRHPNLLAGLHSPRLTWPRNDLVILKTLFTRCCFISILKYCAYE